MYLSFLLFYVAAFVYFCSLKMFSLTQNEAQPFVIRGITLLQRSSTELVSLLPSTGFVEFSKELCKSRVIKKREMEVLARMDQKSVSKELLVRYLVQQVCEGAKMVVMVFDKFVGALDKLYGSKELVCRLRKELDVEGSVEADSGEVNLYEHDIPCY